MNGFCETWAHIALGLGYGLVLLAIAFGVGAIGYSIGWKKARTPKKDGAIIEADPDYHSIVVVYHHDGSRNCRNNQDAADWLLARKSIEKDNW